MKNLIPFCRNLSVLFLLVFFVSHVFSQITFQRAYGGSSDDYCNTVEPTPDGGYILAGRTLSFGVGGYDIYLLKTDEYGDTLWAHTYGNTSYDEAYSVQPTSDGGYIVIGECATYDFRGDLYLIKTDENGIVEWDWTYGTDSTFDKGFDVRETSDGGYILTGYTRYQPTEDYDVYLIKTDSAGTISWEKTIGGTGIDRGQYVREVSTGGYIVSGWTTSFGAGNEDVYLIRTDASGNITWTKTYGGGMWDNAYEVEETADGGFIVAATTDNFSSPDFDAWLIKTDASGNLDWNKMYGTANQDFGRALTRTSDGGYLLVGRMVDAGGSDKDFFAIRTDAAGDTLWTRAYGGSSWEEPRSVRQTPDGGFVIAGFSITYGPGGRTTYLVKIDSLGNVGCNTFTPNFSVSEPSPTLGAGGVPASLGALDFPTTAVRWTATVIDSLCGGGGPGGGGCGVTASFSGPDEVCVDVTEAYTNTSIGATSYQWEISGLLIGTLPLQEIAIGGPSTITLSLIASDPICSDTAELEITAIANPVADAGGDTTICETDTLTLNASGGGTYLWSTGETTATIEIPGTLADPIAWVQVTEPILGCTDTDTVMITWQTPPIVDLGPDIEACEGDTLGFDAGVGGSPLWSTGETTPFINVVADTTFTLGLTVITGTCASSDEVTINVTPLPSIATTASPVSCFGLTDGAVTSTSTGDLPYGWVWSTGDTGADLSGVGAGTYAVTLTDGNGCQDTATAVVTEPDALELEVAGEDVLCNGDTNGTATALAGGGTPAYAYTWSNGENGPSITGLGAGTYTVTLTDANGCTETGTVTINEPPGMDLVITETAATKGECDASATVSVIGGTPGYAYVWSDPNAQSTETADSLCGGTYTVTVTDANGCTEVISTTILDTLVGIPNNLLMGSLEIFPNPGIGVMSVRVPTQVQGALSVTLIGTDGRELWAGSAIPEKVAQGKMLRFDFSEVVAEGIYYLRLQTPNGIWIDKMVILD